MSPSRACSSHSSSWSIFSSARLGSWPFSFSSDLFFSARKSENCHFLLPREKKMELKKATYKKTFQYYEKRGLLTSKIPILRIHTIKTPLISISTFFLGPKNLTIRNIKKIQLGFSSEIKVPQLGSARLGTFIARLGSSWKFPARAHH